MDPVIESGRPAPTFTLPDLEGVEVSLEGLRGRLVVLNFWSAECPWAERADRALLPRLARWGERVSLLSIAANANEDIGLLKKTAAERGLAPVLVDDHQKVARLYQAQTTPHIFLVDERGILRYHGAFDDATFRQPEPTRFYLFEAVEALLSGRSPDPDHAAPYGCTVVYQQV